MTDISQTSRQDNPSETLWVTDAELIRRMGVPEKIARVALAELDRHHRKTGFPQKQEFWGNRRYWPAVKAYLDQHYSAKIGSQITGGRNERSTQAASR